MASWTFLTRGKKVEAIKIIAFGFSCFSLGFSVATFIAQALFRKTVNQMREKRIRAFQEWCRREEDGNESSGKGSA